MPRQARIDAPGALHHIIIRGIESKPIFRDERDKGNFLERLGSILSDTSTPCYAWALMTNHVHLLLRTGLVPIATVMRRLLTGYAQQFNRRHRRHGQLFQNRYKSILCEEDPYLLELIRYIHLNPIRAGLVKDLKELRSYRYSGHAVLLNRLKYEWQDKNYVLRLFAPTQREARKAYLSFVGSGLNQGRRPELVGGGLIRSHGGWSALKALRSKKVRIKGDERILGSTEFVEQVLEAANEQLEQRTSFEKQGLDSDTLLHRVAEYYEVDVDDLMTNSKAPLIVKARAAYCYLAVRKLGISCAATARKLKVTPSAVSKAVVRGQKVLSDDEGENILY